MCQKCKKPDTLDEVVKVTKEMLTTAASKIYDLLDKKKKNIEKIME